MSKSTFTNRRRRAGGRHHDAVEFFTRPKRSLPFLAVMTIWRWRWELITLTVIYLIHARLVEAGLTAVWAVVAMIGGFGTLIGFGPTRRFMRNRCWCVITRHRLRVCLRELRTFNYSGNAAFLLTARSTKEGEALWLWMRPGLSIENLENRTEVIAAACWARDSRITRSHRLAALVRIDILRRDPLEQSTTENPLLSIARKLPAAPIPDSHHLHITRDADGNITDVQGGDDIPEAVAFKAAKAKATAPAASRIGPVEPVVLRNGEDVSDYV